MKILVTGATSGLGRNAAEYLLQQGHQVHATGRNQAAAQWLHQYQAPFTALDLEQAGVEQCVQLMQGCDAVWHCAAKSSAWGSWAEFYQANVLATRKLAQAAGTAGVARFVHISTPSVYFDYRPLYQLTEEHRAKRFANFYAATKYAAEQEILELLPRFPATSYIILRPRALFGPHDRVIMPWFLTQLQAGRQQLRLPGGGKVLLDLTFVLNVVQAMMLATTTAGLASGRIYNITNQQPRQLVDVLHQLLTEQLGWHYQIRSVPYPLVYGVATLLEKVAKLTGKEPLWTRYGVGALYYDMTLDNSRAISELGYQPQYNLTQAVEITAQWLRQQGMAAKHG
ncbi:NAD(P)-dependent oxidoreductase [Snodgrassella sp. ESL0253]|uniref:NAD-dependent epimerase/dehydratase family protein n=1 Tax=Snodgrassella sp. ESL0253 TaxID=2705031 RepID=UPI001581BEED|nr:NAD(P)-dependent oxidoreductase [Snodgrassella sp. ESL0253]NUE66143.1 NAD(P)-dependent oxidoreductase [Snodgrassella sp. ESL0253]